MRVFRHSGATGDIIFSLPVIKALGGGKLYLTFADNQRAESIKRLIEIQPYISEVILGEPEGLTNDLDNFRAVFTGAYDNLIDCHFRGQQVPNDMSWVNGWLEAPVVNYLQSQKYSVINRTARYNDPHFDWNREIEYLRTISERIYFIGYQNEWQSFNAQFQNVDYFPCDFLQGSSLLKYAQMYTGGYSAWSTIAQGLGIRYRLEQAPGHTCSSLFIERETIINI